MFAELKLYLVLSYTVCIFSRVTESYRVVPLEEFLVQTLLLLRQPVDLEPYGQPVLVLPVLAHVLGEGDDDGGGVVRVGRVGVNEVEEEVGVAGQVLCVVKYMSLQ